MYLFYGPVFLMCSRRAYFDSNRAAYLMQDEDGFNYDLNVMKHALHTDQA